MESGKVKVWHSIVTRLGLFFICLIILAISISGFLIYIRASSIIAEFSKERIAHTSALAEQSFYSLLSEVENDISIIAENEALRTYARAPEDSSQKRVEDLFRSTLKNKPNYFQLRYISISDKGEELIRLDKLKRRVLVTPNERLQSKSQRPYYLQALSLNLDELHFSPISLNEEFGVISPPFIPTIRAVKLIPDSSNKPIGMVVINIDLRTFYKDLRSIMASGIDLMLIDESGQYLFAADMNKCFSGQLATNENFSNDYTFPISHLPTEASLLETITGPEKLNHITEIKRVTYSGNMNKIFFISSLPETVALTSVLEVKKYSYFVIPIVSIFALLLAIIILRPFAVRIGSITQAIGNETSNEQKLLDKSIGREDELGVLARTFLKMKTQIDIHLEQLNNSLLKEQKAIKEKDEFLQNMSHELRTPLNSIMGLTQLLKKNKPRTEQIPIVDAIYRSSQSLTGLMHDILDHQKLMEGRVQLQYKPAKISEILTDIYSSYQFDAISKGLAFELRIDDKLKEHWYQIDPLRLTQIVTNLIVNAIKFTDKGKISLEASIDDNKLLLIEVLDTGRGIQAENLKKIRERFYQEQNRHATSEGFGLGLSIVKQLVDLFNGELIVDSKTRVGSTFSVKLPLLLVNEPMATESERTDRLQLTDLGEPISILHVEDDESARLLIRQIVASPNIEMEQTNNWGFVLQYLQKNKPDLIISDVMLDSIDLSDELIATREKLDIPTVVISALEETDMQSISNFYLQKPFDLDQLIDLIITILGKDKFEQPQLATSYAQYDNHDSKIKRFLELLITEFETYIKRVEGAFENKDESEWIAIRHKLVTHIKSLELNKLDQTLPQSITELDEQQLNTIKKFLLYDLSYFRNELRLLKQADFV